uniref:Uncharacterized protein n=1 Tax=Cannabis sativa TaxID=3483 RepID=A0A803Q5C9_CANSA
MEFAEKWVQLVHECVGTVRYMVINNGIEMGLIVSSCGICQGKIYKASYFPNISFLGDVIGNNLSYIWRSILEAKKLILFGALRRVGNGSIVSILDDMLLPIMDKPFVESRHPALQGKMVRVYGFPTNALNQSNIERVVLMARKIMDLPWNNNDQIVLNGYARVKIKFHMDQKIFSCRFITINGRKEWIQFQSEEILLLCYRCGRWGHDEKESKQPMGHLHDLAAHLRQWDHHQRVIRNAGPLNADDYLPPMRSRTPRHLPDRLLGAAGYRHHWRHYLYLLE